MEKDNMNKENKINTEKETGFKMGTIILGIEVVVLSVIVICVIFLTQKTTQQEVQSSYYDEAGTDEEKSEDTPPSETVTNQKNAIWGERNLAEIVVEGIVNLDSVEMDDSDEMNAVAKYVNENILDDFLDGFGHFEDHIAKDVLEEAGYVGFDERLLKPFFLELDFWTDGADVVYLSDVEYMEELDYYRIGICTTMVGASYSSTEYNYNYNNYCAFYASVFERNGKYTVLPFDYEDADLYAPMFGCSIGEPATGAQQQLASDYLIERIMNEAACQSTDRELFAKRLEELEEKGRELKEEGYKDTYNQPGVYSDSAYEGMFYEEPPTLVYE